jgi:hypothetical protein
VLSPTENRALDDVTSRHDRKGRFVLFSELEVSSHKSWLIHKFLGAGEASALYGKPGDGKSVLAEDLGLHVAAGRKWHGREVKQGAVLLVALERRKLVERRAIAFRKKHNLTGLPFAIVGGVYDFRDARTAEWLAEVVGEVEEATGQPVVLIILDTLSRALCGGDENSPKDMGAIVNATSILQERTKAHVLWVHHMPLDGGERLRGHGALLGALDTTVHVTKAGTVRTATVAKANDSEEGERIAFTLDSVVIGRDGETDTTAPIVVPVEGSAAAAPQKTRKLSDRNKLALAALAETVLNCGKPAPASFQLPLGIRIVAADDWREELFRRGVIERSAPNPRQDFKRIREALAARNRIGQREGYVWSAAVSS